MIAAVMRIQIRPRYIGDMLSFLAKQRQRTENPLYVRRVASGTRKVDTTQVPRSRSWTILRVESHYLLVYIS